MLNKLRNNIGAVILITILGLVLMGATYVNLGPTSNIDGDVGVTAGHGYYIDDVLLTYSDVDAEQADATLTALAGLTIGANELIYGTGADAFSMLAANADATNKFLRQISSGVPTWAILVAGDIPDISATYQPLDTGLTNLAALTYASDSFVKVTATDVYAIRTLTETKTDLSLNYVENLKVKLNGTAAPAAATDDVTLGYAVGSRWFDITNDKEYVCLDNTDGAAVWTETTGAGAGYTNLTSFVDQTAWRVFYSNTAGDVTELALGADGTYLKSNGAAVAPTFETPAGSGTVTTSGSPIDNDFAKFTAPTVVEGRSYAEVRTDLGLVIGTNVAACGANTDITSIYNTSLKFGRDADNLIDFTTDNRILFRTSATDGAEINSAGELDMNNNSIGFTQQSTTGDGTTTIDWKLGNKFKFTFGTQNDTFTFTAPTNPCNILLMLIQDGTGSRLATWPGTVKWADGTAPTLTTGAGTIDICSFYWDGTNYFGVASLAFATP